MKEKEERRENHGGKQTSAAQQNTKYKYDTAYSMYQLTQGSEPTRAESEGGERRATKKKSKPD